MTSLLSLLQLIEKHSLQLHECLLQEKQALDASQYEWLCELSTEKQSLVEQLQGLDQQREAFAPGEDFNTYIASSAEPALISQWDKSREVIRLCQQQNEVNGRLLFKRNQLNLETLAILSGRDKPSSQTYNAQGGQAQNNSMLTGIKV